MDWNFHLKNIFVAKKPIKMILLILLLVAIISNPVLAASSGGLVTLRATVSGLPDNSHITVTATKEIDGVLTYFSAETNTTGIAEIKLPFGGTAKVTAEAVSGYTIPTASVSLTKVKGAFIFKCSLLYEREAEIPVTNVAVVPAEVPGLLVGSTVQLTTDIDPDNAGNQLVIWQSLSPEIATVDSTGLVTAIAAGNTTITVTTDDGGFQDSCQINVVEIVAIEPLVPNTIAAPGSTTQLPAAVTAILSDENLLLVPVLWTLTDASAAAVIFTSEGAQFISLSDFASTDIELEGTIVNSTLHANLTVLVSGGPIIPIASALIDPESLALYIGLNRDTATLTLISIPENADTSDVQWISSNPAIAAVESVSDDQKSATIRALATGYAIITVGIPGQSTLDSCLVSVAADPLLTDPAYIVATTEIDPTAVDQFINSDEVWVRCYNLPSDRYYVKVTDKGSGLSLGSGEINVSCVDPDGSGPKPSEFKYHLKSAVDFILTSNYSASYFIYMSSDSEFPAGDDELSGLPRTFMDNFKIGSPVPTGYIDVVVRELFNGSLRLPENLTNRHVILGREIKTQTIEETDYGDYLLGMNGNEPIFSDEAKLIGHIQGDGSVKWDLPKEKLKIGGYVLCIELPSGYSSNLNDPDPAGEDGELVKEVHILRNKTIDKMIIAWD